MSRISLTGEKSHTGAPPNPKSKAGRLRSLISPEIDTLTVRATSNDFDYLATTIRKLAKAQGFSVRIKFVRRESRLYVRKLPLI